MTRRRYMQARRLCKRLYKRQVELKRAMASDATPSEQMEHMQTLSEMVASKMALLQLDAWEARLACNNKGIQLPPPHRSEEGGYRELSADQRHTLRQRLEAESDANHEILISQGE